MEKQYLKIMCEKCFENNIYKFRSEIEFKEFEKDFDLKNKFLKIDNSQQEYLNDFQYVYNCENCKTIWWLSLPENAWRGYFLKEESAKKHIEEIRKDDKRKKVGCFILLGIIIFIIISISFSCDSRDKKFNKAGWEERIDGFYTNREQMVDDIIKNYLHKGMSYDKIINLLGEPENYEDTEPNTMQYEIMKDFGWDIDPVEIKTLVLRISKDSTYLDYKIEHWEKE
ncbi:hypothetical protein [Flavobacterium sp. GCM10027622]|uniref:hypothetical protein n=1 Tax=unclassified Flavobacterium TaxID=196869 RepID=UPI0036170E3D